MTRRRWVLHDLNSRFNCLNPRYNVGTPFFALVDDYADERPKDRGAPVTYGDDRPKRRHTYGDGRPKDRGAPVPLHSRGARRAKLQRSRTWSQMLPKRLRSRKTVCGRAQARRRQAAAISILQLPNTRKITCHPESLDVVECSSRRWGPLRLRRRSGHYTAASLLLATAAPLRCLCWRRQYRR